MAEHVIKLPDVGEGVAEAELVEWHVKLGDLVREDAVLAAVMTDKATVEIPSPVDGEVTWLGGEVGDTIAVGSPIVKLKVAGEAAAPSADAASPMDAGQDEAPIAHGMAVPSAAEGAIKDAVSQFWNTDRMTAKDAMERIASAARTK